MELTARCFGPLPNLQTFEDQFLLVSPIVLEAHATIYVFGDGVEGRCVELFPKYYIESHFLLRNSVYVYKEKDLFDKSFV